MFGYISTSLNRDYAESFAYNEKEFGKVATLFHIKWANHNNYFYMNNGAFKHEDEVLLLDGSNFEVLSVDKVLYHGGISEGFLKTGQFVKETNEELMLIVL
jgi:hypothetical protein